MNYQKKLTIIIVTYKSDEIIYKFLKKIPKNIKVIVVENSKNKELKKNVEKKFKNTRVYLRKNEGVASSINFGVSKLNTEYFIHLSPDLSLNFNQIKIFFYYAKKLDDNFCALGPRFLNTKKKGHIQIDEKLKIGKINSIHGSYMFMKKKILIRLVDGIRIFFYFLKKQNFATEEKLKIYFVIK